MAGRFSRIRLPPLTLNDLSQIEEVLSLNNFPKSKWLSFGLKLGLYKPTLDDIEEKHKGDPRDCLMECLEMWIKKVDNAGGRGPTTWDVLALAVRKMEEEGIADKIIELKRELSDPASQILQKYSDRLSQVTVPYELLHTEGIVAKEVSEEVKMLGGRIKKRPLRLLRSSVHKNHESLKKFATILLGSEDAVSLANDLLRDYYHSFASSSDSSEAADVLLGFKDELQRMQDELASLLDHVSQQLSSKVSLPDLVAYMRKRHPELVPQLAHVSMFGDVRKLIETKCSVVDVTLIGAVINRFVLTGASDRFLSYKSKQEDFCKTSLNMCRNIPLKSFSWSLLICNTVKFVLKWKPNEHTLSDVLDLLWKAFKHLAKRVSVIEIKGDRLISVTCYAPRHLMDTLFVIVQDSIESLVDVGLVKLTIGQYNVYGTYTVVEELKYLEKQVVASEERIQVLLKENNEILSGIENESNQLLMFNGSPIPELDLKEKLLAAKRQKNKLISQIEHSLNDLQMKKEKEKELMKDIEILQEEIPSSLNVHLLGKHREQSLIVAKKEIERLQETMSFIRMQLREREETIKQLLVIFRTENLSKNKSPIQPLSIGCGVYKTLAQPHAGKAGMVKWFSNGVELNSPSPQQCVNVISELLKPDVNHVSIRLSSSAPDSTVVLLSQLYRIGLRQLEIHNSPLNDGCAYSISQSVGNNQLKLLDVRNTSLTSNGLTILAGAVKIDTSIERLVLSDEKINDEDIQQICEVVVANETLKDLTLSNCDITDNGIIDLSTSLQYNNTMTSLDLRRNLFTADGVYHLLEVLATSNSIKKVEIGKEHEGSSQKFKKYELIKNKLLFS